MRTFTLSAGTHETPEDGMCVMEAAAYIAGEAHSDEPECVSKVIGPLAIWLNDHLDDNLRNHLMAELPWRLVGTRATLEIEQQRLFMLRDWCVRHVAPIALDRISFPHEAKLLRELVPITDRRSGLIAQGVVDDVGQSIYGEEDGFCGGVLEYVRNYIYALDERLNETSAGDLVYGIPANVYSESFWRSAAELIDRMIKLTEIKEKEYAETESAYSGR